MEIEKLWKQVLAEIELSVSKGVFHAQFIPCSLRSFENNVATIAVPNAMIRGLIETRYYSLIKSIFDANTKKNTSIIFTVIPKKEILREEQAGPLFQQTQQSVDTKTLARKFHIRPESTFDSFAVSSTNQIAYAAATAVSHSPGTAYNPLFFYGGVGVGKTHLMHAIANAILDKRPATRVVYCMGDEFLNEIVEAIQTKGSRIFKQKYRSAQLLLVDDVQFIAGKQTAQEEFFHTFNAVHREGAQIVLTSDRPPSEISRLEDRLRSRFEGGLLVDISQPDFELRTAIVNIKSITFGFSLPPDAAQMIAANTTDTRALEGILRRILSEKVASGKQEVTMDMVTKIVRGKTDTLESGQSSSVTQKRISIQDILETVSTYYDIKPTAIKGPKRDRPITRPRQLVMYLCKTELGATYDDIGGMLGGRDHTTVMHGVETITQELSTNERLREALVGIKQQLWASPV